MADVIRFYSVSDEHGCFSNFAQYPIKVGGKLWPTSEHFFQAQKFEDKQHGEAIRKVHSPMIAARMGETARRCSGGDWESAKVAVMTEAVRATFTQHEQLWSIF